MGAARLGQENIVQETSISGRSLEPEGANKETQDKVNPNNGGGNPMRTIM